MLHVYKKLCYVFYKSIGDYYEGNKKKRGNG